MRSAAAAFLLAALMAGAAWAQSAPERLPVPVPRPESAPAAAAAAPASGGEAASDVSGAAEAEGADAEAPDRAAADSRAGEEEIEEAEPSPDAAPTEPPVPERLAETELELGRCLGRLDSHGTVYEQGRAISEEGGACGIANPVRVSEIVAGVALAPPAIMRCETAAAMAEWVARFALPASRMLPDRGRLVEVTQGTAYLCRRVNNAAEGDLSEHAFGNAIDVMSFRFASGPPIPVEPREREGTPAEAYQRTVRAAACLSFTTVLGPGQEAHEDHLHLDVKERRGGFRLCQ